MSLTRFFKKHNTQDDNTACFFEEEDLSAPLSPPRSTDVRGQVKVAKYYPGKRLPETPDFVNVLIHTQAKPLGGDLSPYVLRNEHGHLIENIWQFSKVYPKVKAQRIPLSWKYHPNTIIWEHPEEVHLEEQKEEQNNIPNDNYWAWRKKGMESQKAVRYPNGFEGRHQCQFCWWVTSGTYNPAEKQPSVTYERLDYITARKRIYCAEYARLAPRTPHFKRLKAMLNKGQNLQLIEVDGPDPTLTYAPYDRLSRQSPGLTIDEPTIRQLISDPRKPFGHGYVIAALLLDGASWMA